MFPRMALLLILPALATADVVLLTSTQIIASPHSPPCGTTAGPHIDCSVDFATTGPTGDNDGHVTGDAFADAAEGSLHAHAHMNNDSDTVGPYASATAGYSDVFTIQGYSGAGFIRYHFTGATSIWNRDDARLVVNQDILEPDPAFSPLDFTTRLYMFDGPVSVSAYVFAAANVEIEELTADISASLAGIEVFDTQMQPVTDFSVGTSRAAFAAPRLYQPFVATPEPGTVWLLLSAGILLAATRIRRRVKA